MLPSLIKVKLCFVTFQNYLKIGNFLILPLTPKLFGVAVYNIINPSFDLINYILILA